MKYRKLGKSNLKVSEIGFGAWAIALDWWGGKKIDDQDAIKMLKRAYDLGINFYETADIYGNGKSEKLISQAFKGMNREELVYSTKWGYDIYSSKQVGHNEIPQKHDTDFLQYALQKSMDRLQADYVDVYSLHNPKMSAIQNDSIFRSLDSLISDGKIRSYGVALGPAIGWMEEGLLATRTRNITCLQTVYNILEQDPGRAFFDAAYQNDVGIIVRVPDASGILTGKVKADTTFDKNDHRGNRKREWILEALQKVEKMRNIAESKGLNITELAFKFILSQREISVVLPTILDITEVETIANMSDGNYLDEKVMVQISDLYNNNFDLKPSSVAHA
ncbi:MAG: aldo/keto reductase [Nitrososphaeraceae archaeon]|jgi:aryl-alcohol dehydrogenase-like predicted oxidoreductase